MLSIRKSIARQSSLREKYCVPYGHPFIRPEGAKIIGINEAFPFRVKNSFQKIMKLVFKSSVWKASIKSTKVPSTYMS